MTMHTQQPGHPLTRPRTRGFTLIEVLIVVAIVGITGAIVVPQMLASGTLGIQAAARMVIADMLYAQNEAIAQQAPRRVVFHPDQDRYELTDADGNRLDVKWRTGGGENYEVDLRSDHRFQGVQIVSAEFGDDTTLEFDDMGAPAEGGKVVLKFNDTRYEVDVAPFTGRVTVAEVTGGG